MISADSITTIDVHPEDTARADMYALIARLCYGPPDAPLLYALSTADELLSSDSQAPMTLAWRRLQAAATATPFVAARDEFDALFIGVGTAPLMPYESYYLTGFLMERPLAELRDDLARLGLMRLLGVSEPEDHIASLADVMRFLIVGDDQSPPASLAAQKRFFRRHLQPWCRKFAADMLNNNQANFYKIVAEFMQEFFVIEIEAFETFEA